MADGDFLEILNAPQIPVLANCAQIEARHAERFCADLAVPGIEAAEEQVSEPSGSRPASIGFRSSTKNRNTSRSLA